MRRYSIVAVVIVPDDAPADDAIVSRDATAALEDAGYLVKWCGAHLVPDAA